LQDVLEKQKLNGSWRQKTITRKLQNGKKTKFVSCREKDAMVYGAGN
jgi:hypothetical protein